MNHARPRDGLCLALAEAIDAGAAEGSADVARYLSRRRERVRATALPEIPEPRELPAIDAAAARRAAFTRAMADLFEDRDTRGR